MKATKKVFKTEIIKRLKAQGTDEVLSEAALPAYAHKNPLIDHIFWKRLKVVADYVKKKKNGTLKVLDFGCGTGVMSYELASNSHEVVGLDLDLRPVHLLKQAIKYPDSITFMEGDLFDKDLEENSFDVVIALDVLEHMNDEQLIKYMEKFRSLLKDDGEVIISGPTENFLYKIGRKLAGQDFTGDYHDSEIQSIRKIVSKTYKVKSLAKILPILPLFDVFVAHKKA
ncbi:class I SAM-dependent methyltransferase [Kordia sp. YSTF-M3]|uniref:Class I SAM-dependent methyltransferase n=1 Tax=Kordia aestuariivivens TaxID=2759037 RepID=A0ABR7Q981_9FLAO|nr:class I SAM-dependent methyltransferase [Kordia aestuariivivens]MBC8755120.1 class I SAM-dependent methyltransferase [Kordia aestuariivivens]